MSKILDIFGLDSHDFFSNDQLALCGNDRKIFGQIKQDSDGHFRITVGEAAQDCNGPVRQVA